MEDLKTYDWAIKDAQSKSDLSPRYLLLGNGFSIGGHEGFGQGKIRETLKKEGHRELFNEFKDEDPEQILRALENAEQVLKVLHKCPDKSVETMLRNKTQDFKNAFIEAIAKQHPQHPQHESEIIIKFTKCREFLVRFLGKDNTGGAVYTLNYDILLLWVIVQNFSPNLFSNDDFSKSGDVLKWPDEARSERQGVYYLHGALMFYAQGTELYKHELGEGKTILDKVKESLEKKEYPLFIAGGIHHQKQHDIHQVPYLKAAHDRFKEHMDKNEGCLFLYGVSLSENDRHIWDHIINGKIPQLYVGLYGDDRAKVRGAEYMKDKRSKEHPLKVDYFCAESANVWDTPSG